MKISVEFLSMPAVTKTIGGKSLSLNFSGKTIDDLANEISNKYGQGVRRFLLDQSGKLDRTFKVVLNKKEWLRGDQLNKTLNHGDQVTIMMLVAGG